MKRIRSNETICINSLVDGKQPSIEWRIYSAGGASPAITTFCPYLICEDDTIGYLPLTNRKRNDECKDNTTCR